MEELLSRRLTNIGFLDIFSAFIAAIILAEVVGGGGGGGGGGSGRGGAC